MSIAKSRRKEREELKRKKGRERKEIKKRKEKKNYVHKVIFIFAHTILIAIGVNVLLHFFLLKNNSDLVLIWTLYMIFQYFRLFMNIVSKFGGKAKNNLEN